MRSKSCKVGKQVHMFCRVLLFELNSFYFQKHLVAEIIKSSQIEAFLFVYSDLYCNPLVFWEFELSRVLPFPWIFRINHNHCRIWWSFVQHHHTIEIQYVTRFFRFCKIWSEAWLLCLVKLDRQSIAKICVYPIPTTLEFNRIFYFTKLIFAKLHKIAKFLYNWAYILW
jgi:hypothetical protein